MQACGQGPWGAQFIHVDSEAPVPRVWQMYLRTEVLIGWKRTILGTSGVHQRGPEHLGQGSPADLRIQGVGEGALPTILWACFLTCHQGGLGDLSSTFQQLLPKLSLG